MRLSEILRLVWLNLSQNKFKVILTSIGIVVGSATIMLVLAIGTGGKEEVAEQFREVFPEDVLQPGKAPGKYQLDLWKANQSILLRAGIQPEHMAVTNVCTCHNPEYLFSHRASHGQRGNLAAFLMLKESWVPECLTGIKKI